ncbi:MAG: diguanylate cyclase [Gemmatimonadales bacterium]
MPRAPRESRTTLMALWETRSGRALRAVGLDSVRTTILSLAVLASLIPALATGWISYRQNRRAIQDKLTEQLSGLSVEAAREMDLWLKEALYNLRVFATSYEVTENIARGPQVRGRLPDYLRSVRERFADFEELLVVAPNGRTVASSERSSGRLHFEGDWISPARSGDPVLGDPFPVDSAGMAMEVAVPVVGATGRFLGVMVARMNFRGAKGLLHGLMLGRPGRLILLMRDGRVIVTTSGAAAPMRQPLIRRLEQAEGAPISYTDPAGTAVVGTLTPIHRTGWGAIADIPQATAFAQIRVLRNTTVFLVLVLLAVVGSLAYALGLLIVRPIERLSGAARRVAGGDLEVAVPTLGSGELAQLTLMFNDMVRRLREGRQELERLSVTDPLTGLANRRRLMAEIEREVRRSDRLSHRFAVLMLDVDHFKKFNDTHGHPAGDELLKRLARALQELVREVDTAARYGGEEFMVILTETPAADAVRVGERIRARVSEEKFAPQAGAKEVGVTVSIGLAEFPADGNTPESLIAAADQALYRAKEGGRNRVVAVSAGGKDRKAGGKSS